MSYPRIAVFISIFCASYSILYVSVLLKYEASNSFVYALGVLFNSVALSIIASCIFYLVTDFFPKKHQLDQIRNYVISNLEILEGIGKNAFTDILKKSNPTQQEFKKLCNFDLMQREVTSCQDNSLIAKSTNWFEYFTKMHKMETDVIHKLMIFESMIPIEVRLIFIELQKENTIFSNAHEYKKKYDGDKSKRNFIAYADDIYSHLSLLVEIVDTYNKTSIR